MNPFKWIGVILAIVGVIGVAGLLYNWGFGSSTTSTATTTPPASRPAAAPETVRAANTSKDCPGELSPLKLVGTVEETFNPKGCYFYSFGDGEVEYTGLFLGSLKVNLKTGRGDTVNGHKVYNVRSVGATQAKWQFILCAGAKQDMSKLDCS